MASDWNELVRKEIEGYLGAFQTISVDVTPKGASERTIVPVHVPYMHGTVSWVDDPEVFGRLSGRTQARLKRVKEARENAPAEVQLFLASHFLCEDNSTEKPIAKGRSTGEV